jgi:hypothetical protein
MTRAGRLDLIGLPLDQSGSSTPLQFVVLDTTVWRKSSASGATGCVEFRHVAGMVEVRDSKDPTGPSLTFDRHEWTVFIAGVRLGEFDLPS